MYQFKGYPPLPGRYHWSMFEFLRLFVTLLHASVYIFLVQIEENKIYTKVEMRGLEPRTLRMQSARSTAELHPQILLGKVLIPYLQCKHIGPQITMLLYHRSLCYLYYCAYTVLFDVKLQNTLSGDVAQR